MPYIKPEKRARLDVLVDAVDVVLRKTPEVQLEGELNYLFTSILKNRYAHEPRSYFKFNRVVGLLECVKLELYRRWVSQYEDEKIKENGDLR